MKTCKVCRVEKPLDEFYKNKTSPDGRKADCIPCRKESVRLYREANLDQIRERNRSRPRPRKRNAVRENEQQRERRITPEGQRKQRERRLRTQYGLSLDDYESILERQKGACAICKKPPPDQDGRFSMLFVDHSHDTAAVRGLLCHSCNIGLGHFQDDRSRMLAAIGYLARFS